MVTDNDEVVALVNQWWGLSVQLARRRYERLEAQLRYFITDHDLFSAAQGGLWKAARSFDPAKGLPFPRFAKVVICQCLSYYVKRQLRPKRYRPTVTFSQWQRDQLGRPSRDLNTPDRQQPQPIDDLCYQELLAAIRKCLPGRYWRIFVRYYLDEMDMRDIAREEGISYQRVSQLMVKALKKIHRNMPREVWTWDG